MRLGIGSFAYAWAIGVAGFAPPRPMTALDLVERAAELGVRLVQIGDNLPLHRLSERALDELQARAAALSVDIEVGTRGIAPEQLVHYLELAERFSSPILRIVIDTALHHPDPVEVVETLRPLLARLERSGVILAIENHDRFGAATLAEIVTELASPAVGICLDTINSLGALEGTKEVTAILAPLVVSLHVKDVLIRRSNETMGFVVEGRPAGQGMIDVPWLIQEMHAKARSPNAILELWPPQGPTIEATIATEDEWAKTSIRYLRAHVPGK